MKMNLKDKVQYAIATATVAVLSSPAMADTGLMDTIKTELGGLKEGVIAIGVIAIGIGIAFATISIGKRGTKAVG